MTTPEVVDALAAAGIQHRPEYIRQVREQQRSPEPPAPGTSLRRVGSAAWAKCGACGKCPVCTMLRTYPDSWVLDLGKLSDNAIAGMPGVRASVSTVRRERVSRGVKGWPVGRPRTAD